MNPKDFTKQIPQNEYIFMSECDTSNRYFSTSNRQNNYKRKMQIPAFYKVYVRQCKVMFNYSIDTCK